MSGLDTSIKAAATGIASVFAMKGADEALRILKIHADVLKVKPRALLARALGIERARRLLPPATRVRYHGPRGGHYDLEERICEYEGCGAVFQGRVYFCKGTRFPQRLCPKHRAAQQRDLRRKWADLGKPNKGGPHKKVKRDCDCPHHFGRHRAGCRKRTLSAVS